jgi:two-component system NtrC family sensor kinase
VLRPRLAVQLTVSITVLIAVLEGAAAVVNVRTHERQLVDHMILGADQLSRGIASATWHAMLRDNRQGAYEVMQTVATKQGVDWIRIFNKEGRIVYSTRAETGRMVDKNTEACFVCHTREQPLVRVDVPSRARTFRTPGGRRTLGLITPIYNERACSAAPCHAHPSETSVLGILDVGLDLAPVDAEIAALKTRTLAVLLAEVALVALFLVVFTRRFLQRPIARLVEGTRAVAAMQLDHPIEVSGSEEMRELARSFDAMRQRLQLAVAEINDSRAQLETRVRERTTQLEAAQRKLLQTDRLASLGQLAASVAHEINNPLSGVLNLSMLMQRIVKEDGIPPGRVAEVRQYLADISSETARAGRIVSDLLAFSRRSAPRRDEEDLNALVRKTSGLVDHKLRLLKVEVVLDLAATLPLVPCDGSQVQQVVLNLVLNAAEAMEGGGRVTIATRAFPGEDTVQLSVTDSGAGIEAELLPRIFDPFFTTKEEGKGVGLGLAVVYGIVQAHGGDIEVESTPGKGTRFRVVLPLTLPDPGEAAPGPGFDDPAHGAEESAS